MSDRPSVYLGVDGGGTKTEVVVITSEGHIVSEAQGPGTNLHNLPLPQIANRLHEVIGTSLEQVKQRFPNGVDLTSCLGLAGLDTSADFDRVQSALKPLPEILSDSPVYVCNDGLIALASGADSISGLAIIASTGANCFGVNHEGQSAQAGDWGYLLGDQGSSFALGKKLLETVFREYDGRNPTMAVSPYILKALGVESVSAIPQLIYGNEDSVSLIAGLSKILENPEVASLPSVEVLINHSVADLIESAKAVASRLKLQEESNLPVVLVGGLMRNILKESITEQLTTLLPNATITTPQNNPVWGAISIAKRLDAVKPWVDSGTLRLL